MYREPTCPKCNGTGIVWDIFFGDTPCPTCRGTFHIESNGKVIKGEVIGMNSSEVSDVLRSILGNSNSNEISMVIKGGNIGVLNTGDISNVESISSNIADLDHSGEKEIAKALIELSKAVTQDNKLNSENKSEAISLLEELSKQAKINNVERVSKSTIKAIYSSLSKIITLSGSLAEIWSTWGASILKYFNI